MKKISFRHNCCLSNKRLTTSIWKVKQRSTSETQSDGSQPIPTTLGPKQVRVFATHSNTLRQIIQLLNVQGTQDVTSTTKGWQHPWATQMMPQQQKVDSTHGNPNAASATTAYSMISKNRYQFNGDSTVSIRPTKNPGPQYKRLQPTPDGNKPTERETKKPSHGRTTNTHKCRVIAHWHRLRTS